MDTIQFLQLSTGSVTSDLIHLGIAYALALPIGWNREHQEHTAGIRTFPIVAVASCGLAMVTRGIPGMTPDSYSRVLQGLVTGIGFIGGGAILRDKAGVTGTATAASVWNIGIVGAAVGLGGYHIAAALSLVNYLTLRFMTPFKVVPKSGNPDEQQIE
jgi:putative Mg2+ transporter-C (MgtC) family protein